MPLTIFTWNIEQFGKTRVQYNNRLKRVGEIIQRYTPDIAVIIEVKSKKFPVAKDVGDKLLNELGNQYRYILTHHNLLETYLYLYNTSTISPRVLASGKREVLSENDLSQKTLVAHNGNTGSDNNVSDPTFTNYFPLLTYDSRDNAHRPLGAGFFYHQGTDAYISVVSWHNESGFFKKTRTGAITDDTRPLNNLKKLPNTGFIQNGKLTVNINDTKGNRSVDVKEVILTGDFNVDGLVKIGKDAYKGLREYTTLIGSPTYLNKYVKERKPIYYTSCYDNFVISKEFNKRSLLYEVFDVPGWLKNLGEKSLKAMINDSCLGDIDSMEEITVEINLEVWARIIESKEYGYIKVGQQTAVCDIINDVDYWPTNWDSTSAGLFRQDVEQALQDREKYKEIAEFLVDSITANVAEMWNVIRRFGNLVHFPSSATLDDTTFLMLKILSDHLPVVLKARN